MNIREISIYLKPKERKRIPLCPEKKDYQKVYDFFLPKLQMAENAYFPKDGPLFINHQGLFKTRPDLVGGFTPAREYLQRAGARQEKIDKVLNPDSSLKKVERDNINIWNFQNPDEAATYVAQKLKAIDELVQISVDASLPPYGFNRHRQDHQADVYFDSQWMLRASQPYSPTINSQTYVNAAIVAISHDHGILEGRGDHSLNSVITLQKEIPGIDENPRFISVATSIIAHDPPRLKEYLKTQEALLPDGSIDPDKAFLIMRRDLPDEALAVISADRGQFGIRRVPENISNTESFDQDPNIFPNMIWEARPSIQGNTFIQSMYFNPFIDPRGIYSWAGKNSKKATYIGRKRIFVPSHMHKALKEKGIPYSLTAEKDFFKMYGKDFLTIQIAAVFALNPHLENFKLVIDDPFMPYEISQNGQLMQRVHVFRRGHIKEDLEKYKEELGLEDKKAA